MPKTKRNPSARAEAKTPEIVEVARQYGREYFDGDRKYGYGGYRYDGRWQPVAQDFIHHYQLEYGTRILDIGCAKGFLVKEFRQAGGEAFGLDVSLYALQNCHPDVVGYLQLGTAADLRRFPDGVFDLVISINTLHNLPRQSVVQALKEIMRVSKGKAFVQVDSYHNQEQKDVFLDWVLTAKYHGYPREWLEVFAEAGYTGDYDWTLV